MSGGKDEAIMAQAAKWIMKDDNGDRFERETDVEVREDLDQAAVDHAESRISDLSCLIEPERLKAKARSKFHKKRLDDDEKEIGLTPWGKRLQELVAMINGVRAMHGVTDPTAEDPEDLTAKEKRDLAVWRRELASMNELIEPEKAAARNDASAFRETIRKWDEERREYIGQVAEKKRIRKVPGFEVRDLRTGRFFTMRTDLGPVPVEVPGSSRALEAKEREFQKDIGGGFDGVAGKSKEPLPAAGDDAGTPKAARKKAAPAKADAPKKGTRKS